MTRSDGHRFAWGLVALALVAAPRGASGQGSTAVKGLGVRLEVGGPAEGADAPGVALVVPAEAPASASASAFLVLVNASGARIEGLEILGYLVPEARQAAAAPTISIKVEGAATPAAGWTIEAGKTLPITLTVSNVDPSAPFEGRLVGVRGGAEYGTLARVKVERVGARLEFLDTGPDGAVKLDLTINTLRARLTARSTGPSAFDLDLVTTPLIGPNGQSVEPRVRVSGRARAVDGTPGRPAEAGVVHARVEGPGLIYVDLESDALVAAGAYSGRVELRPANGAAASAHLTVNRVRSGSPVRIDPLDSVHDVTYHPCGGATAIRVSLEETSGQSVTLNRPALAGFVRKEGAGRVQAADGVARIVDDQGKDVVFPLVLDPGAARLLSLELSPIHKPGEYTGSVQFSSPDYDVLEQSVTVMKKHSGCIAFLVIAVGIALSFAQRTFFSRTLPRKQQMRDASKLTLRLRDALGGFPALNDREQVASDWLTHEIKAIHDAADGKDATRARLKLASDKLNLFTQEVPARVLLDSVHPQAEADSYRQRLDAALGVVLDPTATVKQCADSATTLRTIPTELFATVRGALKTRIDEFLTAVQAQIADQTIRPELRQVLQHEVEAELKASAVRLENAERLAQVEAERIVFDTVRGNYARILSRELRQVLAAKPPEFPDAEWTRTQRAVGRELDDAERAAGTDPDSAIDDYNRAFAEYVHDAATMLNPLAQARSDALTMAPEDETQEQKDAREAKKTQYDVAVISVLNGALKKLGQGNVREADVDYQEALSEYRSLARQPAHDRGMMAASPPQIAPRLLRAAAFGPSPRADSLRPAVIDPATEIATIDHWVDTSQIVMLLLTLVVGTLTGLQTLWVGNPTWGGWDNITAALVWGAGLQQIAGLSADQIMDALDRVVR